VKNIQIDPTFSVPATIDRIARATVSVQNGDTIILGGFVRTKKSKSNIGVPFLKDIPGLGVIFRKTEDRNERVELIVLIRPTVLKSPEEAAFTANEERNKLPGLRAAELEFERESQARMKESQKLLKKKRNSSEPPNAYEAVR
jgi:general secretion pathway protein D